MAIARRATHGCPRHANGGMSIEICEMRLDDIAKVYALGETLFTADRWPVLYRTWDEYELTTLFTSDGETCLVAEHERQIVGFALGQLIEKRRSSWRYGYLLWMGVAPAVARCGVGSRLAKELIRRFETLGARIILADSAADNTGSLDFLKQLGFGQPQEHVYPSMNLSTHPSRRTGSSRPRTVPLEPTREEARSERPGR